MIEQPGQHDGNDDEEIARDDQNDEPRRQTVCHAQRDENTNNQELVGDDLQKMVLLQADQGTPDVVTLDAGGASMRQYLDKFKRAYGMGFFMTDGQSGSGSIQEVIRRYPEQVWSGMGMAGAAQTIAQTWGKNAVEVPDVKNLGNVFFRKLEDQIDATFD